MIKLYVKNNCMPCKMTKNMLANAGIKFISYNVDEDFKALEEVQLLGLAQAPVVVHHDGVFSGFQPDKVKQVIARELGKKESE